MTARDELVRLIGSAVYGEPENLSRATECADALIAAGWRKMLSREALVAELTRNRSGCYDSAITDNEFFAEAIADAILALMEGKTNE